MSLFTEPDIDLSANLCSLWSQQTGRMVVETREREREREQSDKVLCHCLLNLT